MLLLEGPCLQLESEVDDAFELEFEAVGAAAAVAEVDLAQSFGGDLAEVVLVDAVVLGLKEEGGVAGRQGEGEATYAGLIGAASGGGRA